MTGASNYALLLRHMLVHERGDELHLLAAVPDGWLADGQTIRVRRAPTHFGELSLTVRGAAGGVQVEFDAADAAAAAADRAASARVAAAADAAASVEVVARTAQPGRGTSPPSSGCISRRPARPAKPIPGLLAFPLAAAPRCRPAAGRCELEPVANTDPFTAPFGVPQSRQVPVHRVARRPADGRRRAVPDHRPGENEGRGLVVLHSPRAPAKIVVAEGGRDSGGARGRRLFFLGNVHGWASARSRHGPWGAVAEYEIVYADGQKQTVPLITGRTIDEWTTAPAAEEAHAGPEGRSLAPERAGRHAPRRPIREDRLPRPGHARRPGAGRRDARAVTAFGCTPANRSAMMPMSPGRMGTAISSQAVRPNIQGHLPLRFTEESGMRWGTRIARYVLVAGLLGAVAVGSLPGAAPAAEEQAQPAKAKKEPKKDGKKKEGKTQGGHEEGQGPAARREGRDAATAHPAGVGSRPEAGHAGAAGQPRADGRDPGGRGERARNAALVLPHPPRPAAGRPVRPRPGASGGEIRVFDPEGKRLRAWTSPVVPEALGVDPAGIVYVAGQGQLAKFDADGKLLLQKESPHAAAMKANAAKIREEVIAQFKQRAEMIAQQSKVYEAGNPEAQSRNREAGRAGRGQAERRR